MSARRKLGVLAATLALGIGVSVVASTATAKPASATSSTTLGAIADTFVTAAFPDTSFGATGNARVFDNPAKIAYYKFSLDIPAGSVISSATLKLTGVLAQDPATVDIYHLVNSWDENTTYNTRPVMTNKLGSMTVTTGVQSSYNLPLWTVTGPGEIESFGIARSAATTANDTVLGTRENPSGATPQLVVNYTPKPYAAYTSTSFFRTPLGSSWPVDSTSTTGITWDSAHEPVSYPKLTGVPTTSGGSTINHWGVGFALGTCSDPVWHLASSASVPSGDGFLLPAGTGFHAPSGWQNHIPQNSDAPIEVIDSCGNTTFPGGFSMWAAGVAYTGTNTLSAAPGDSIVAGVFDDASNGLDARDSHSNSTANSASRGNIPDSFAIRTDEVLAAEAGVNSGTLGHVIQLYAMHPNAAAGFVSPMVGAETQATGGYGAEGQRIALLPTWTPPPTCTGAALAVAKTLQAYGAYIGNTAGNGSTIKVQQDDTTTGLYADSLGACFSWSDMAYVQRGWSASW